MVSLGPNQPLYSYKGEPNILGCISQCQCYILLYIYFLTGHFISNTIIISDIYATHLTIVSHPQGALLDSDATEKH